jgi:hypothetical protein
MGTFLQILGKVWIIAAVAVVLNGYGATWYFHGFSSFGELLSPFNIGNWLAIILALLPGILLVQLGGRIKARHARDFKKSPPAPH